MSASSNSNHISVNCLVLDAAPLLTGTRLDQLPVDEFYTVPEVISEVKDARSRENLARQMQLINLKQKSPSEASMSQVVAFAKKTGDFAVLSFTDLKVIALAVTLEKEKNGASHLRSAPVGSASSTSNVRVIAGGKTLGYRPAAHNYFGATEESCSNLESDVKQDSREEKDTADTNDEQELEQVQERVRNMQLNDSREENTTEQENVEEARSIPEREPSSEEDISNGQTEQANDAKEDSGEESEGWITPKNVARYKAKEFGQSGQPSEDAKIDVAVMSSDFALQNVLMQMNVKLMSPESGGMVIKKLKNWVLRCHACFHITTDMSKKFCPACGNSGTLLRASTQVDSKTGQMKVFLKENFTYKMRGTQFSVPMPKGGRRNNDLILREDQIEYKRAVKKHDRAVEKQSRNPTNPFDPDYVPAILIDATGKKQSNPFDAPVIGYGKRNPNEVRRKKK